LSLLDALNKPRCRSKVKLRMLPNLSGLSLVCPSCPPRNSWSVSTDTTLEQLINSSDADPATCEVCLGPLSNDTETDENRWLKRPPPETKQMPESMLEHRPGRTGPWVRIVCENDHVLHTGCAVAIILTTPQAAICPTCRQPLKEIFEQLAVEVQNAPPAAADEAATLEAALVREVDPEGDVWVYDEDRNLLRIEYEIGTIVSAFRTIEYPDEGYERTMGLKTSDGSFKLFVKGPRGQERKFRVEQFGGVVQHYEGPRWEEYMVRLERPYGQVEHYLGPKGDERLIRVEFPDATVFYYEGLKGEERKVRIEFPSGDVFYYEGPKGEERKLRVKSPNGTVDHYEGPKDEERVVRMEWSDGAVIYYEGPRGEERIVREESPDGQVKHYGGPPGQEHVVRSERRLPPADANDADNPTRQRQRTASSLGGALPPLPPS